MTHKAIIRRECEIGHRADQLRARLTAIDDAIEAAFKTGSFPEDEYPQWERLARQTEQAIDSAIAIAAETGVAPF